RTAAATAAAFDGVGRAVLLPRPLIRRLRSSADRAAGFGPACRGSTPLGGSDTVAERRGTRLQRAITAVRVRPVSSCQGPPRRAALRRSDAAGHEDCVAREGLQI